MPEAVNSLDPVKCGWNFRHIIFKQTLVIHSLGISCEITLIWMSIDFTDYQSTLIQVMAWCRQADFCRHMASLGHSELTHWLDMERETNPSESGKCLSDVWSTYPHLRIQYIKSDWSHNWCNVILKPNNIVFWLLLSHLGYKRHINCMLPVITKFHIFMVIYVHKLKTIFKKQFWQYQTDHPFIWRCGNQNFQCCYIFFLWLCVWGGCNIIFCQLVDISRAIRFQYQCLCCMQKIGYFMSWSLYSYAIYCTPIYLPVFVCVQITLWSLRILNF